MQEHAGIISATSSATSYGISVSLIIGDWIAIVDQHTWVVGVFGFLITWITNVIFKIIQLRREKRA